MYAHAHWHAGTDKAHWYAPCAECRVLPSFVSAITHGHCLCMQQRSPVVTCSKTELLDPFFSATVFHSEVRLCSFTCVPPLGDTGTDRWVQNYCLMIHSCLTSSNRTFLGVQVDVILNWLENVTVQAVFSTRKLKSFGGQREALKCLSIYQSFVANSNSITAEALHLFYTTFRVSIRVSFIGLVFRCVFHM